jgi:hypothetical protein
MRDLNHLFLAGAKNTDCWRTRKGDLQRAFPLDILMVPSSALALAANGEPLSCDGFSLGETICFGSLEFIAECFGGLSLSPRRDGLDAAAMGSTRNGPPSSLRALIGDSTEEFHMASDGDRGGPTSPLPEGMARGFGHPHHNNIMVGEHSDHSGCDNDSTAAGGTMVRH